MNCQRFKQEQLICEGKVAYESRSAANAALADFQSRPRCRSKRVYNCNVCGKFHLTSHLESAHRAKKIDKVVAFLRARREMTNGT